MFLYGLQARLDLAGVEFSPFLPLCCLCYVLTWSPNPSASNASGGLDLRTNEGLARPGDPRMICRGGHASKTL